METSLSESTSNPSFRIRSNMIRTIIGLLVLLALISRNSLDPTPFNLLWPHGGVKNLLSLPGALLAGLLYDLFGWCALIIPIYLLLLKSREEARKLRQSSFNLLYFLLLVGFVALCFPPGNRFLSEITGFWGTAASTGLLSFPGRPISLILTSLFLLGNITEYRFNLQVLEISKEIINGAGSYSQRLLAKLGSLIFQFRQFWIGYWASNAAPFLSRLGNLGILGINKLKGKTGSRLAKIFPIGTFESLFSNSTQLFKSRLDTLDAAKLRKNRLRFQTSDHEYKIFQEALKEFERKYYQSYFSKPPGAGGS